MTELASAKAELVSATAELTGTKAEGERLHQELCGLQQEVGRGSTAAVISLLGDSFVS